MLTFDEAVMSGKLPPRFWGRVIPWPTGCWRWMGAKQTPFGHGRYWINGYNAPAHKVAYEAFFAPLDGLLALHRCDVADCVNPYHIFPGTQADNMLDKCNKGRQHRPIGDLHHLRILSEAKVVCIKRRLASGVRASDLAREYGVHNNTIYGIKNGWTWIHVVI